MSNHTESKRETWLRNRWPLWEVKKKQKYTYHRQFVMDHMMTKAVFDEGDEPINNFADSFKWYFHSWPSYKLREHKLKGKTFVADPGVPMDKVGSAVTNDTDFHRVVKEMAKASNKQQNRLKTTLGMEKLITKTGDANQYHIDPDNVFDHAAIFNWQTLVKNQVELRKKMAIPQEIQTQLDEIVNNPELELILDIIQNLDNLEEKWNIPDLDVDAFKDELVKLQDKLDLPFAECDP